MISVICVICAIILIVIVVAVAASFLWALVSLLAMVPLTGFYLIFVTHEYSTAESRAWELVEAHPIIIFFGALVVLFIAYVVCSYSRLGLAMLTSHLIPVVIYEFFDNINIGLFIIIGIVVIPAGFLIWFFIDKDESRGTIFGMILGGMLILSQVSMYWSYALGNGTSISENASIILAYTIAILVTIGTYFLGIFLSKNK